MLGLYIASETGVYLRSLHTRNRHSPGVGVCVCVWVCVGVCGGVCARARASACVD